MSSFYINKHLSHSPPMRDKNDWEEASNMPLPTEKQHSRLTKKLSDTLRENSFMESQINFLKTNIRRMADKNTFLQDQYLILKEQFQILKTNKVKTNPSTKPNPLAQSITPTTHLQPLTFHPDTVATHKTIHQQRKTIQSLNKLLNTYQRQNWNFFVQHKKRKWMIQTLNTQLQSYLKEIHTQGNIFQKLHTSILNKKKQEWLQQIQSIQNNYKNKFLEIENKYTNKLQEAKCQYQSQIKQIQLQKETEIKDSEKNSEALMNEKSTTIQQLNQEIKHLRQQQIKMETEAINNITEEFKNKEALLLQEKETELQTIKKHYISTTKYLQENHQIELKKLKEKYQRELHEQSEQKNKRIIELKEEHDNSLHLLRTEMEQELLAEKRNAATAEKTHHQDIQKLQKDFMNLKSEMELNAFKNTQAEINENELTALRVLNHELQKKNKHLQNLWQKQQPEIEKHEAQIANLQKLNRELSSLLRNHSISAPSDKKNNLHTILQNIHTHTEID